MELVKEFFKDTYIAPHAVYLDYALLETSENATTYDQIRTIILIIEKDLWPDDLIIRSGVVLEGTNLFTQACFSDIDETVDYCFQIGNERPASLIKVTNLGESKLCDELFQRQNRVVTPEGDVLEAQYLATYENGIWHVLNERDRFTKLDCESDDVIERATHISL